MSVFLSSTRGPTGQTGVSASSAADRTPLVTTRTTLPKKAPGGGFTSRHDSLVPGSSKFGTSRRAPPNIGPEYSLVQTGGRTSPNNMIMLPEPARPFEDEGQWNYVGEGRGNAQLVHSCVFVGEGNGSYELQQSIEASWWPCASKSLTAKRQYVYVGEGNGDRVDVHYHRYLGPGLGSFTVIPEHQDSKKNWSYVGTGRGAYEKVERWKHVGLPSGSFKYDAEGVGDPKSRGSYVGEGAGSHLKDDDYMFVGEGGSFDREGEVLTYVGEGNGAYERVQRYEYVGLPFGDFKYEAEGVGDPSLLSRGALARPSSESRTVESGRWSFVGEGIGSHELVDEPGRPLFVGEGKGSYELVAEMMMLHDLEGSGSFRFTQQSDVKGERRWEYVGAGKGDYERFQIMAPVGEGNGRFERPSSDEQWIWSHVGEGKGSYEEVGEMIFLGEGNGSYRLFQQPDEEVGRSLMVDAGTKCVVSIIMLLLIFGAWALAAFYPSQVAIEASEFGSAGSWLSSSEHGPSLDWSEGCKHLEEGAIQRLWLSKTHIGGLPAEHWQVYAQVQVAEGGESKLVMTDVNHWGSRMWGSLIYARCEVLESDLVPNFLAEATEHRPAKSGQFHSLISRARWTVEVQGPFHPMAMQRVATDFVSRCNTYFVTHVNCQTYAKSIISAATKETDIQAVNVRLWTPFLQEYLVMAIVCFLLGICLWLGHNPVPALHALGLGEYAGTVAYFAAMMVYLIGSMVLAYVYANLVVTLYLSTLPTLFEFLWKEWLTFSRLTISSPVAVFLLGLLLLPFLALYPEGILDLQLGFWIQLFPQDIRWAFIPFCLSIATWKWILLSITGLMLNAILWLSWRRYQEGCLLLHYAPIEAQLPQLDPYAEQLQESAEKMRLLSERKEQYSAENGTHVSVSIGAWIALSSFVVVVVVCFLIVGDLRESGYYTPHDTREGCAYREISLDQATPVVQTMLVAFITLYCILCTCCCCMKGCANPFSCADCRTFRTRS